MRRTAEMKRQQLLDELVAARQEVLDAAAALPGDRHGTALVGHWTVGDLVAHLAGWDYANLEGVQAILAGKLPAFYGHYDTDWRTFNAALVARHKRPTLAETIAEARSSHRTLVDFLTTIPAEEIFRDHGVRSPRGRRVTISMLLTVEARDEKRHAGQVREHLNSGELR